MVVETVKCPKCSSPVSADAKFCPECGNAMQAKKKCPKCGTEAAANAKFCPECGTTF
jgi:membrane protease subunit (stomatin/prohibitin family)